jgi:hypothetical protein
MYVVGTYDFDRVRVDLEQCTVVSPRFVSAIENALEHPSPKSALKAVFQKYGQVVGTQVTLGGRLFFIHRKEDMEVAKAESVKSSTSVALGIAIMGIGGSVGAGFGSASDKQVMNQSMDERISFQAIGGDVTLVNEPEKWKDSIKSPALWEVIRYDKLIPTVDLLEPVLKQRIMKLWDPQMMPGAEVIAHLSEIGDTTFAPGEMAAKEGHPIEGFQIKLTPPERNLSLRYWSGSLGQDNSYDWIDEGGYCGTRGKGAPLEMFAIKLQGFAADQYDLHYRAQLAKQTGFPGGLTNWVSGNEMCGGRGERIEGIQVVVAPAGAGSLHISADSYVRGESKGVVAKKDSQYPGLIGGGAAGSTLTYRFNYPGSKPVTRLLEACFTSDGTRPVRIQFNNTMFESVLQNCNNADWDVTSVLPESIGEVELLPGENILTLISPVNFSPLFKEFRLGAVVRYIPATSYMPKTSKDIKVVDSWLWDNGGNPAINYQFIYSGKRPARLALKGIYRANDPRPVTVKFNGITISDKAMGQNTGGWNRWNQLKEDIGVVEVLPGLNTLTVSRAGVIPHIREFQLIPREAFVDFDPEAY